MIDLDEPPELRYGDSVWDAACEAWLKQDMRAWYRFLRDHCGYRSGRWQIKQAMEQEAQGWIDRHPTWRTAREIQS